MRSLFYVVAGAAAAAALVGCVAVTVPVVPGVSVTWKANVAPVAATIAARLAPRLRTVLDKLRKELSSSAATPLTPDEARRLIDAAEEELVAMLQDPEVVADLEAGARELAPLGDYVRDAAAASRSQLDETRKGTLAAPGPALAVRGGGVRADWRLVRRNDQPRANGPLEFFLAAIALFGDRVDRSELQTTLCAISRPPGVRIVLFPASAPDLERVAVADDTISSLWRGSYRYRVEMIGGRRYQEVYLDLMSPERVTLVCAVEGGEVVCRTSGKIERGCPR